MKDITLVIMAAGLGTRFGGLKQMTSIDDNGNFIIDYSIYDAIKAGVKKVVIVTSKQNEKDMKETIGKRIEDKIDTKYAIQDIEDIPTSKKYDRTKPWGTVQAVLAARDYIDGDFIIINADDFYGFDAYKKAVEFLNTNRKPHEYASIAFKFINTINDDKPVKRGVLTISNGVISDICESSIRLVNDKALCTPLDGSKEFTEDKDTLVSMNMFAFKKDALNIFKEYFKEFFTMDDETILKSEALVPTCLNKYIQDKTITIYSIQTTSRWIGMTYKEDLDLVKNEIGKLRGIDYEENLWGSK